MKRNQYSVLAIALFMAAALCAFTPGARAQSSQAQAGQQSQAQQQGQAQQQSKTFAGVILKLKDGKYALIIGKTPQGKLAGHFLDDQNDAKKYDGKKVRVTGTLDMASNTIHVSNIQPA